MATMIIDGIEYCIETPLGEDDGDNSNKPSSDVCKETNHCR